MGQGERGSEGRDTEEAERERLKDIQRGGRGVREAERERD